MNYVRGVEISYGDKSGTLNDDYAHDLNSGFGVQSQTTYVKPLYTGDRKEAACGFSILTTYQNDLNAADYSAGDGKELYRYLRTHERYDRSQVITRVYLSTEQDGHGYTDNLNKDRGGRDFYLNWVYDKRTEEPDAASDDDLRACVASILQDPCPPSRLRIEQIQFSQDSISSRFQDGRDVRDAINGLIGAPLESRLAFINAFPPIRLVPIPVTDDRPAFVSLDNRRLHIMRSLLPPGTFVPVQWATVKEAEELIRKWTAKGSAMTIVVRGKRSK